MGRSLFVLLVLAAVLSLSSCGKKKEQVITSGTAAAGDSGYVRALTIDMMRFGWKIDGGRLSVKLSGPAGTWISVGFNPEKGMKGANFVIGYVENGKVVVTDQHGIDKKQHRKDTDLGGTDDVKDAEGWETKDETVIRFTIPLVSPDALDKPIHRDSNTVVMLACGKSKQTAQQHVFWAKARINLVSGDYAVTLIRKGK